MTPISEMTNAELDEHIAKLRGWEYHPNGKWEREGEYQYTCPSFTTDPRYAMELLEEMKGGLIWLGDCWGYFPDMTNPEASAEGEDKFRVISEAYAQWKGEK